MKIVLAMMALLLSPVMAAPLAAQTAPAEEPRWSDWMSKRGHFQFRMRAEQIAPNVIQVHTQIRPDVKKIAAEPYYANEVYYLEYYQGYHREFTGGRGDTSMSSPRRLMFPANAPETCVYEEKNLFALTSPPGDDVRLYIDLALTPLPIWEQYGEKLSGFERVINFGSAYGPGATVRFSGIPRSAYTAVC